MRTTLDIPEKLIKEAMELTRARTKSQSVKEASEAQIAGIKRKRLITKKELWIGVLTWIPLEPGSMSIQKY